MATPVLVGIAFYNYTDPNSLQTCGFSEVYPMKSDDYSAAIVALGDVVTARLEFMCPDVANVYLRVSDVTVRGDSSALAGLGPGTYVVEGISSTNPNTTLRILSENVPLHRGVRYLHCLPQDSLDAVTWVPTVAVAAALDTYMGLVKDDCMILSKTIVADVETFTPIAITTIAPDGIWTRRCGRPFGLHRGRAPVG